MIGKTTLKCRSGVRIVGKEDLGLQSLVWMVLVIFILFFVKFAHAQSTAGSKSKAVPSTKAAPDASKAEVNLNVSEQDDNEEGNSDQDESLQSSTDDNPNDLQAESQVATQPESSTAPQESVESDQEGTAESEQEVVQEEPIPPPPDEVAPQPIGPAEEVYEKVADANLVEVIPSEKNVEIEPRRNYTNYRDRRTRHGFLFSLNSENLYFQDYTSIIDQTFYEKMFGQEDLTIVQGSLSYKLNFFLGSLVFGGGFGQGTLIDDRFINAEDVRQERTLTISKTSGHAQWLFDSLMKEPYFVPYAGFSMWQMDLTEAQVVGGETTTYTTGYGTALTVGFLVQLNWIEPETSKLAYLNQSLENTYLDVFWTQYQNTDEELDPAFENDFNFGVGIKMEF